MHKRRVLSKFLRSIFVVFICLTLTTTLVKAYSTYKLLSVPNMQQSNNYSCWRSVGSAILQSEGYNVTTSQFANACGVSPSAIYHTATIYEIRDGFLAYNRTQTTAITGTLTFSQIITQIDTYDAPVVVGWHAQTSGTTGHVVALSGYNSLYTKVYYMDPAYGLTYLQDYSYLCNNSSYYWYQTVYDIHS